MEKIEAIIAKPTRVHGLLVFHPGERSVETWVLWGDHLWEGRYPGMEWRSTKVYRGHPRLEGVVCHSPVSYTHKPSVCKSLQTSRSKKYKKQLAPHVTLIFFFLFFFIYMKKIRMNSWVLLMRSYFMWFTDYLDGIKVHFGFIGYNS